MLKRIFLKISGAGETGQQLKVLAATPDGSSSDLEPTWQKERNNSSLSTNLHTCEEATPLTGSLFPEWVVLYLCLSRSIESKQVRFIWKEGSQGRWAWPLDSYRPLSCSDQRLSALEAQNKGLVHSLLQRSLWITVRLTVVHPCFLLHLLQWGCRRIQRGLGKWRSRSLGL